MRGLMYQTEREFVQN